MLLDALRARLSRAVPSRSMVVAGAGIINSVGTTQRTTPPKHLKLVLAFEVGQMEGNLLGSPHLVDGRETLPIIHLLWKVLGHKDGCSGHHHKFNIGNGHASPFYLLLSILHHDDELGGAICLDVVQGHVEQREIMSMVCSPPLLVSRGGMISRAVTFA